MDKDKILELTKARIGISGKVRDTYLAAIIDGVLDDLVKIRGIRLDENNAEHLMFCVDYATWRYQSRDSIEGMPRHLQFRMHNLFIKASEVVP